MRRVLCGILAFALTFANINASRLGDFKNKREKRQSNELTSDRDRAPGSDDDVHRIACEGHCRSDRDCAVGLKCFERKALEVVPGCSGLGEMGINYCYDPVGSDVKDPAVPVGETGKLHLSSDLSTPGLEKSRSLVDPSFFLDSENVIPSPPLTPAPAPVAVNVGPPVYQLVTDDPQLEIVGMNGEPSSAFPLKKCQGHCWGDIDCEGDLVCFKMFEPGPIPGCSGEGEPGRGYCFDVADYPPSGQDAGPGFRLKMYWELGYYWQEESFERPWCMKCDSYCVADHCSLEDVSRFEFVAAPVGFQIRIDGTENCFQHWRDVSLIIEPCDPSKTSQWFTGDFQDYRFELHPYGNSNECLAVTHHPKDDEIIYVQDCEIPRSYKTSYWNLY